MVLAAANAYGITSNFDEDGNAQGWAAKHGATAGPRNAEASGMRQRIAAAVMLLAAANAYGITWNFDKTADPQGWLAREFPESLTGISPPLRWEVSDGIWRIWPHPFEEGRKPSAYLISPELHHDSALFDQLRLRFRVVHTRPIEGSLTVLWTNAKHEGMQGVYAYPNPDASAGAADRVALGVHQDITYTGDWQEIVVGGLRPEVFERSGETYELAWEGELLDVQVVMRLYTQKAQADYVPQPEDIPEAVEVDWIRLTGPEEQLAGELPPPQVGAAVPGGYLEVPVLYPLDQRGLGFVGRFMHEAVLGDADGDGGLDLLATWQYMGDPGEYGWLVAANDGTGRFARDVQVQRLGSLPRQSGRIMGIEAGDLDGDGFVDAVVKHGTVAEALLNRPQAGWEHVVLYDAGDGSPWPLGLADADGDGDLDMWWATKRGLEVLVNDSAGHFPRRVLLGPEVDDWRTEDGFLASSFVESTVGGQGVLWIRYPDDPVQGFRVTVHRGLEESARVEELTSAATYDRVSYAGDFDLDGDTDMVIRGDLNVGVLSTGFRGLELLLNPGDGMLEQRQWYGRDVRVKVGPSHGDVRFVDLDGEGALEGVFVDANARQPAVVVSVFRRDGVPVEEGRYPLEGAGGEIVSGDVDGDGDTDLVVPENSRPGGGSGVHVLLNRRLERSTAVAAVTGPGQPVAFRLGEAYPNPFNPATSIPFEMSAGSEVRVGVYNAAGQLVRTLVDGQLNAGPHEVRWDGVDAAGNAVATGVYLVRLRAGAEVGVGKMVKVE